VNEITDGNARLAMVVWNTDETSHTLKGRSVKISGEPKSHYLDIAMG